MIDPRSRFIVAWNAMIIFVDLTYTAFGVPLAAAFCEAGRAAGERKEGRVRNLWAQPAVQLRPGESVHV